MYSRFAGPKKGGRNNEVTVFFFTEVAVRRGSTENTKHTGIPAFIMTVQRTNKLKFCFFKITLP